MVSESRFTDQHVFDRLLTLALHDHGDVQLVAHKLFTHKKQCLIATRSSCLRLENLAN